MSYEKHSHLMAKVANAAYLDLHQAREEFSSLEFSHCQFIQKDGAQAYIISNKDMVVLAFRGTEPSEISDIKADLNAFPDRAVNGCGLVHNGFQEEVNKIWDDICVCLRHMQPSKDFFITGHSLGGAMATIATSRMRSRVQALFTFGSPRVGTRKFVESIKYVPHFRFVNNNDIVTSVPPAILGYRHTCKPQYINHYGEIRPCTYWQRLKDKLRGRWRAFMKGQAFDGAYDHSMTYYVKYTEKMNG